MINLFTLFFAPSFLILIQYFEFEIIVLTYICLSIAFFIYAYIKKKKAENFIIIAIYLLLLIIAYFFTSFETVKFIPIFTSMIFVAIFIDSTINKKELILKFTQKFYQKKLGDGEIDFLKKGDLFWAITLFAYMLVLVSVVFLGDNILWAFMSSIGWYIYFVIVLAAQILYGKFYAIKMYSK